MQMPAAYPTLPLPAQPGARIAVRLALVGQALAGALRSLRVMPRSVDRHTAERAALAGLNERMLNDIGASPWLVEEAAARTRDTLQSRIDAGLY